MAKEQVGASIVEIITESLYDKPIVIFREYVQNCADSLASVSENEFVDDLQIQIWEKQGNLYFLDNGIGIAEDAFVSTMSSIANSAKTRHKNIGYKGIGRLSGIPYCQRLTFINILDYANGHYQVYTIYGQKYRDLKKSDKLNDLDFFDLMKGISQNEECLDSHALSKLIANHSSLFDRRNTGFLVILNEISPVLYAAINEKSFLNSLSWLLPVPFQDELLSSNDPSHSADLFSDLSTEPAFDGNFVIPARSFNIFYNEQRIERPISQKMLRQYLCKSNLGKYAVCVHTFSSSGIAIDKKNPFSGLRIYYDNILLCDESELIPALQQFGMISHTVNETIQAIRGIGAVIYIVDKVSISTNARRTFIDVTDEDALDFLNLIGVFVETVFQTRYALSKYFSAQRNANASHDNLERLREKAEESLVQLASQDVRISEPKDAKEDFGKLSETEKKRVIKSTISKCVNDKIKRYIDQIADFNLETCIEDFMTWLKVN